MIAIIDYKAGNAVNVKNALQKIGAESTITDNPELWKQADGLIFPGVGSFRTAMKNLGLNVAVLKDLISRGKPFLGICLGMQLLLDSSEESKGISGLGIIPGTAKRFNNKLPTPQIGWNKVQDLKSPLFEGIPEFYAYFVHSYYCKPLDSLCIAATTEYGIKFASAFWKKNIYATQFHPEKSGEIGLKVLRNFTKEVSR